MRHERITKADKDMVNDLDYNWKEKMFSLMCTVMKIISFILFIYQIKNLKTVWIY